jgi:tetratricopeptide (TPR) repeat protein
MRIQRITQFRTAADEAVAAGNFSEARQALEQLLGLLPVDPDAAESLSQIELVEKKENLYAETKTQISDRNWAEAQKTLAELTEIDPAYRDVAQLQKMVPALKTLEDQFQVGEEAFAAGKWQEAIEQFQVLQENDLAYRFEEVRARLFESHLALGKAILMEDGQNPEAVSEAIREFSGALKLDPIDYKAQQERELAEMYLTALNSNDKDEIIELLQVICSENPDYAGTTAVELFYATLLERGDSSLVVNDTEAATADYRAAARLPVEDTSLAQEKLIELAEKTSP